ncbi:MAG: Fe-S cluster assembly protein SufD [Leptolyngbyaceae cyanobacterium bins.302]|nr:Fe-S cluster assembly protein SufD [Leptolyngbyaceae cyanobacterium bins.302]
MIKVSPIELVDNRGSDRSAYLARLLNLCPTINHPSFLPETKAWLQELRDSAASRVRELTIPSSKDEEWRFTDLAPLLQLDFQLADWEPTIQLADSPIQPIHLQPFILPEAICLVFINGVFSPDLSTRIPLPSNVCFSGGFAGLETETDDSQLLKLKRYLAKQQGAEEVFTALNTANLRNIAIVNVPTDELVETPIQVLFVSTVRDKAQIGHPRCLVIAEPGSSLTLVEEYISLDEGVYFTNAVTEIFIQDNAQVNHTRVQRESKTAFHIGKTAVSQARDSRYTCNAISFGAALSRHNLEVYQTGEQTDTKLNGLALIAGRQVADTHSLISFTKPHSTSNQIHKCIVDDKAHAVFNGKIFVPQAAQLTDARQLSQNLLLSDKARVDTKPQLEITADNVKCAHGATVSQLENDEVFYLQSRGISQTQAVKLLTYAFAYEVIEQIPIASLREELLKHTT